MTTRAYVAQQSAKYRAAAFGAKPREVKHERPRTGGPKTSRTGIS